MSSPIIQFQNHQSLVIENKVRKKDGRRTPVTLIVFVPNLTHSLISITPEGILEFLPASTAKLTPRTQIRFSPRIYAERLQLAVYLLLAHFRRYAVCVFLLLDWFMAELTSLPPPPLPSCGTGEWE